MPERQFEPNEVAKLLDLPSDHPDRQRAMEDPEFAALALALAEFSAPRVKPADRPDLESARIELRRRMMSAVREAPAAVAVSESQIAAPAMESRGSWYDGLRQAFAKPFARAAVAFVAVALVGVVAWRTFARLPHAESTRAVADQGAFALDEPKSASGELTLNWSRQAQADEYRVVFIGSDLNEITHLDMGGATRLVLRRNSLPGGLSSGDHISVAVEARRQGVLEATSRTRSIQVP